MGGRERNTCVQVGISRALSYVPVLLTIQGVPGNLPPEKAGQDPVCQAGAYTPRAPPLWSLGGLSLTCTWHVRVRGSIPEKHPPPPPVPNCALAADGEIICGEWVSGTIIKLYRLGGVNSREGWQADVLTTKLNRPGLDTSVE